MANVGQFTISPRYVREDGLTVMDGEQSALPFKNKDQTIITFPPAAIGGNHKHPRTEAIMALDEGLELTWINDNATKEVLRLKPMQVVILPSMIPHVVKNVSPTKVHMIEYADDTQHDVEHVAVI
jgi:uncharacterized RmlC-like cupin family protein